MEHLKLDKALLDEFLAALLVASFLAEVHDIQLPAELIVRAEQVVQVAQALQAQPHQQVSQAAPLLPVVRELRRAREPRAAPAQQVAKSRNFAAGL